MIPITLDGHSLEEVNKFTYLGSVIAVNGGSEEDVKARIGKARAAFNILTKTWKTKNISQDQAQNLQLQRKICTSVRIRHGRTPLAL